MDDFANIAANGIGGRQELLRENKPPIITKKNIGIKEVNRQKNKDSS